MKVEIKKLEIAGALFGAVMGPILHFTYQLSGRSNVVALFSTVNESVWEHTRIFFFPVLIFLAVEWFFVKDKKNLLMAKVLEATFGISFIIGFYYFYTLFVADSLAIDITYFIITVFVAKWISYKVLTMKKEFSGFIGVHVLFLVAVTLLYFFTSFIPPRVGLFLDSEKGVYGVETK